MPSNSPFLGIQASYSKVLEWVCHVEKGSRPWLFKTKWVGYLSLPAILSPRRQREKLHPQNMLSLTLIVDPFPISQETMQHSWLQAFLQCISPSSPSLHDMFKNTYATFLSNPMSVFVALQFIGMRSLDSNFTSMIIQSTIFKWSLEERLQPTPLSPAACPHHWVVHTTR